MSQKDRGKQSNNI
jgi:hypothetical protein